MVLTWSLMRLATDTGERWRRGVEHLLHRGEASRALKKLIFLLFSPFVNCKAERNPEKVVDFDTQVALVWKSDSEVMPVLTDVFLSQNKSVCAQICLTSTDKYTLNGPTNISAYTS